MTLAANYQLKEIDYYQSNFIHPQDYFNKIKSSAREKNIEMFTVEVALERQLKHKQNARFPILSRITENIVGAISSMGPQEMHEIPITNFDQKRLYVHTGKKGIVILYVTKENAEALKELMPDQGWLKITHKPKTTSRMNYRISFDIQDVIRIRTS